MVLFWILVGFIEVLCLSALVLIGIWVDQWLDGVAWDGSSSQFNLHPIMMTLGLIVFNGNALLLYRMFQDSPKRWVKIAHAVMHSLALLCASVSLAAVWQNHNANDTPNVYSIHSWIGITTFILFASQWLVGFGTFLWPGARMGARQSYKPIHVFFGVFIFGSACAAALIGVEDKVMNSFSDTYSSRTPEGYVANFFGVTIFLLAGLVTFTVTYAPWKRPEEAEARPLISPEVPMDPPSK